MAGKRDTIWVADKVVDILQSYLSTKFDALDTEYGDGIVLEDIDTTLFFISEVEKMPGFPLCCVIPESADPMSLSGEFRYGIEYHTLTIAVALVGSEGEEDLKRRTGRTIRGIEETLLTYRTLGGSVNDVLIMSKDYSPLLSHSNALLQEAQMEIRVMTMEE